ncbi:MAG: hypothetical protein J6Y60_05885 [Treponema sp.]|nr:hypothetical protein [Treponema sp.]
MCEIMTIAAAVIFTVVFAMQKKKGVFNKPVFGTMLMFWGAALMWAVDGIACVLEGESFFDISMEDTILGFIILGAGLVIFAFMLLLNRAKKARA